MKISSTLPSATPQKSVAKAETSQVTEQELPRPDEWDLNEIGGEWSNDYDALTYRRTASNVGAAVGGFLSHFAVLGVGVALGASIGSGLGAIGWGVGVAGAALGGAAGGAVAAKFQGATLWGRSVLSKAGASVGNAVGRAMHTIKVPIRTNHVETAESFSIKSLNRYGADMSHTGHKRISSESADRLIEKMKPGDIVLTGDNRSTPFATATQIMTGRSNFTHAIMYKGEGQAIESVMAGGVREKDLKEIFTVKNHAVVIRPDYKDGQAEKAVAFSEELVGKSYDFKFSGGNENWYCSELVHAAVAAAAPHVEFDTRSVLGKKIVVPNDLFYTEDAGVVGEVGQGRTYVDRLMGKFIAPKDES